MSIRLALAAATALSLSACGSSEPAPTSDSSTPTEAAPPAAPVAPTAAMGEQIFKRCMACHTVDPDGHSTIGPNLHGVVGRAVASISGFSYSGAMKAKGGVWDEAALDAYLTAPQKSVPGTRMAFAGIPEEAERKALILYLATLK